MSHAELATGSGTGPSSRLPFWVLVDCSLLRELKETFHGWFCFAFFKLAHHWGSVIGEKLLAWGSDAGFSQEIHRYFFFFFFFYNSWVVQWGSQSLSLFLPPWISQWGSRLWNLFLCFWKRLAGIAGRYRIGTLSLKISWRLFLSLSLEIRRNS